jgi:PAS domain S-box-containing protein
MSEANSEFFKGRRGRWTIWPTQLLHYAVALLSVVSAIGTNLLLSPYLDPTPTPPFFAAVMLSAWYGGLGPGLLATALSTLAINYFFVEPIYSLNIPNLGTLVRVSVFVMAAILINSLNAAQRVAQRRAEANFHSLCESEARFGRLAESNIIGMIVADLNGSILEANDIFLQMVGYTQEELRSGRVRWREMTPPESLEVSERAVQELITTGVCTPFEKEYMRKDGSRIPILHGATMTGETTFIGFALDLSQRKRDEADRKRAQETLQRTNQTLQTLIDACPVAIAFFDPQGIVRLWNHAAERIFGWSAQEAIGQFMPTVPHRPQEFLASIQTVLSGRSLDGFEAQHQRKDGRMVDLEIWANLTHDAEGNPGCLGIAWDITERKQAEVALRTSEERYRLLVATTTAVMWTTNAEGGFICVQPSWEAYTGQSWEEYAGWGWLEMFHPDDREALKARWEYALAERSVYEADGRLWHAPSGQYRHVVARAVPLLNADGSVREWIGTDTDIHERKQVEAALVAQEQRYRYIFEAVSVAIWEEDFSQVKAAIDQLKGAGVRDFHRYFAEHPEFVQQAADMVGLRDVNQAALRMFGAQDKTQLLTSLHQIFVPETQEAFIGELLAITAEESFFATETVVQTLQGDRFHVWLTIAFPSTSQSYDRVLVSLLDISDAYRQATLRKRVQQELQQTLQTLQTVVAASPLPIVVIEPDMTVKLWNAAAEKLFGWSEAELLGQRLPIVPEEKQEECRQLREAITNGKVFFGVETYRRKRDGSNVILNTSAAPLYDDGGSVNAILLILQDITEQQQAQAALRDSEERLRLALIATNQGLYDLNVQTGDAIVTPEYARMLGYEPDEFKETNAKWRDRLHPDDVAVVYQVYEDYVAGRCDEYRVEFRQRTQSGDWKWILSIGKIVSWDSDGQPLRMLGTHTDINERKQAEEALRQSEERLRVALKNSPITVFNQDRDLRYTWLYNPTLAYHATQVIGKQDADLLSCEDAGVLTQIKRRVLETGVGAQEEVKLTIEGQDFYYDLTVEPLPDVHGEIIGITCASIDITDRKQVELALRQSETTLSAFIASSPIGIAFFDRDLRYVHANDALAAINGVPLSEHLGRTFWEVLPEWAPVVAPVLERVMQTQEPLLNQEVVGATHPADVVRHALVNYFPVCLPDGQLLGLGVTSMDISDRRRAEEALRRSEERLRISQDLSLDAFTILDSVRDEAGAIVDFVWTYVNPKAAEILQRPVQELVGQRLLEVLPGNQTNSELFERYVRVVETGVAHDIELSYNTDGIMGWFRNMAVKLEDGVAISFSDITQRKQAEAEREQLLVREQAAREQAEAANRIKDEFLAVLSHELRSPLNPILGWSKLLQTGRLDAQASHRALETIERNAKLQTQLIEDLLDVSRILRGKMALNISPINLVTIVESALETVRLAAEVKHIHIQTIVTLDNGQVSGDSARLQQIVWNLLSNAIKFTPDGGKVEIRLDQISTYAQIQVTDTGKGISPDFLPYVFDYFRQEDGKTTRKFGGLGLGLAIVRHLTELHGGTVDAESLGEGQGAIFRVRLPLMAVAAASEPEISPAAQSVDLSQLRILVVDDEEDMRDLVKVILEQQGAQVTVAATAAEALMLFDRQPPDILISDIGMPDMDGYMLMRQIRQRSPQQRGLSRGLSEAMPNALQHEVQAIALTAYAGEYDQQQALQVGFQKHIPKPVEPEALINAISQLMHSQHQA